MTALEAIEASADEVTVPGAARGSTQVTLIFRLGGDTFGIDVTSVLEIIDPLPVMQIPNATPLAPGLVNVRGSVVAVFDLHHRLGCPKPAKSADSRVLVIAVPVGGVITKLAVFADCVDDITEIAMDQTDPMPEFGSSWPPDFIIGVARHGETPVALLNSTNIFDLSAEGSPPLMRE